MRVCRSRPSAANCAWTRGVNLIGATPTSGDDHDDACNHNGTGGRDALAAVSTS